MAQAYFGTSGFDYQEWKPDFYPGDLPRKKFLPHYAGRFNTVELNNTFYRMPNAQQIEGWTAVTPEHFRFAIKAPRRITHMERLKLPSDSLRYFLETIQNLGPRLGPLLFQLPPFSKCDTARLAAFLEVVPRTVPVAVEFRHDSWFTDEVYRILEQYETALCIHDADEKTTPIRPAGRFMYLRLRKTHYAPELRREWTGKIRDWVAGGKDVYAYLKHEDNPDAPSIALEFARELA